MMTDLADRLEFPPSLRFLLEQGTLRLISESPEGDSATFGIPALREVDREGRITSITLYWRNPATAGPRWHFEWQPGDDDPHFLLVSDTTDVGDEVLDEWADVESLIDWINDSIAAVHEAFPTR